MEDQDDLKHAVRSTVLWTMLFIVLLFGGIATLGRPLLHVVGLLFGLLGGAGLDGTDL